MFIINRVVYSQELNVAEKLNDVFMFDNEIYIDNYLFENKNLVES